MKRKRLLQFGALLTLVLIPVALSWGEFAPPTSFWSTEDVANTKHNLSANEDIKMDPAAGAEVCVFCHTPHGANPEDPGDAPLWNRALPTGLAFTRYSSPNFDAKGDTPGTPKGVSLACLSCHDGTIAFDALINAPGSGGFFAGNRGTVSDAGTSVLGPSGFQGAIVDDLNSFRGGERPDEGVEGQRGKDLDSSPYTGGLDDFVSKGTEAVNTIGSQPFPNLGRDISDDHPISMAIPTLDPQFDEVRTGAVADGSIWKLKRQSTKITQDFSSDKRDVVRAYPTAGGTPAGSITSENAYIECASCHNPHTPRPSFLRIPSVDTAKQNIPTITIGGRGVESGNVGTIDQYPNAGSLICLTCHQK